MKTTFLIATAIILSSVASAQQADVQSKTTGSATVAASENVPAASVSGKTDTKVNGKAETNGAAVVKNTSQAGASTISDSKAEIDNKISPNTSVEGSLNSSGRMSAGGTVSTTQAVTKSVETKVKKSARVRSNNHASVNTNIRPASLKTSSILSTGAHVGF